MSKHWLRNMLMGLTIAVGIGVGLGHAQPVHAAEPTYTIGTQLIKWPWLRKRVVGPRLDQTQAFFEKHGIMAVIFGRFVPVIRTFIPLISGSASFPFHKFMLGNVIGVTLWVALATVMGYYFGSIPFVKDHFSLVIVGIVAISLLPAGIVYGLRGIRRKIITRRRF